MLRAVLARFVWLGWLGALITLGGCSTPPQTPLVVDSPTAVVQSLTEFVLEGRLSLRAGDEAVSGGLRWTRQGTRDQISVTTPMGGAVAEITRVGERIELIDHKGQRTVTETGLSGLDQMLGFKLPLDYLPWWLAGTARVGEVSRREYNGEGRLAHLEQDGWRIDFQRYQPVAGRFLPGKLVARRGEDMELRLVVDQWILP